MPCRSRADGVYRIGGHGSLQNWLCLLSLEPPLSTPHWTFPASSGDFSEKGGGHSVGRGVGTQWRSHFAWLMKEHRRRKTITHIWRSLACLACVFIEIGMRRGSAACFFNTIQRKKIKNPLKVNSAYFCTSASLIQVNIIVYRSLLITKNIYPYTWRKV